MYYIRTKYYTLVKLLIIATEFLVAPHHYFIVLSKDLALWVRFRVWVRLLRDKIVQAHHENSTQVNGKARV